MCIYLYYIQFIYFPVKYVVCDLQDIDSITVKFRFRGNDYKKNNWKEKRVEKHMQTLFLSIYFNILYMYMCAIISEMSELLNNESY